MHVIPKEGELPVACSCLVTDVTALGVMILTSLVLAPDTDLQQYLK